ncbi:hypothetical protein VI06_11045 [Aquitalea magnusonii]|nr:hypothetical protein VI06_11045 [Aquitalea magnusonii]
MESFRDKKRWDGFSFHITTRPILISKPMTQAFDNFIGTNKGVNATVMQVVNEKCYVITFVINEDSSYFDSVFTSLIPKQRF